MRSSQRPVRQVIGDKANSLLQLVLEDLAAQGGVMKSGAIVDATIITSKSAQPNGGEVSPTDPDTGVDEETRTYHHGYKMHAYVDAEPGLQGLMVTSTNVHDSLVFGQVLDAGDQMVYEHKAYASQKDRQLLKECDLLERRSRSMFFAQMNTQLLLTKTSYKERPIESTSTSAQNPF